MNARQEARDEGEEIVDCWGIGRVCASEVHFCNDLEALEQC